MKRTALLRASFAAIVACGLHCVPDTCGHLDGTASGLSLYETGASGWEPVLLECSDRPTRWAAKGSSVVVIASQPMGPIFGYPSLLRFAPIIVLADAAGDGVQGTLSVLFPPGAQTSSEYHVTFVEQGENALTVSALNTSSQEKAVLEVTGPPTEDYDALAAEAQTDLAPGSAN